MVRGPWPGGIRGGYLNPLLSGSKRLNPKGRRIEDAGRHRRTPWTPAGGGEWWMGLKSVDIDLILSNMLVGQWTVVRSVLDE